VRLWFAAMILGAAPALAEGEPIDAYIAAYEAKDVAAMRATLAEDFVYYDFPQALRYDSAEAFATALGGYLATLAEQGVRVRVDTSCRPFQARADTAAIQTWMLCEHASAYRGGGADQDERFLAIYGLGDGRIHRIERLGDLADPAADGEAGQ